MKSLLAFILFVSAACSVQAVDLGVPAGSTPYDTYMHPVRSILGSLSRNQADMERVRELMREGRSFRYSYTDPYNPALPSTTAAMHAGDCKAKALWLCEEMNDQNVRFVVGKMNIHASLSHAWVLWQHEGRWWILDCTNNWAPIAADRVPASQYVPLYSWSKKGEYRHDGNGLLASSVDTHRGVAARVIRRG